MKRPPFAPFVLLETNLPLPTVQTESQEPPPLKAEILSSSCRCDRLPFAFLFLPKAGTPPPPFPPLTREFFFVPVPYKGVSMALPFALRCLLDVSSEHGTPSGVAAI